MPLALALVLHAHQPVGNFDEVMERTYQSAYRPFLAALRDRPWLRVNLHYSGHLLDWLAERHPEYLAALRELGASGRLEMLGGGYYEPILPAIAACDQQAQLARLAQRLVEHGFARPAGVWLAERVWEPELPRVLAAAGVAYTVLDDAHFQLAGLDPDDLHGYWITESGGERVRVIPSNYFLRLAIPFRPEGESLDFLRAAALRHPGSLLTMGDDLEKFGSWPHTARHVYGEEGGEGWLHRFFDGLETASRDGIETVCLRDYLDREPARGLVYLPSASYPEMMQWALPYPAGVQFQRALHDAATLPYRRFFGGAPWQAFLAKYREANLLHKTQLDLSHRLQAWRALHPAPLTGCASGPVPDSAAEALFQQAHTALLASQCNDVYWHGWFGGLYSPHLRNLAYTHLLTADAALDNLDGPVPVRRHDLHGDGTEIIELRNHWLRLRIEPGDGGCVEEIDYRPANANIVNGMQRRPELYHEDIRAQLERNPAALPAAASAPSRDLAALLQLDPYPRSAARTYLVPENKTFADYCALTLDEDAGLAAGAFPATAVAAGRVELSRPGCVKTYLLDDGSLASGGRLRIEVAFAPQALAGRRPLLEMVFNLLAPTADDRWIETESPGPRQRFGLAYSGEISGTTSSPPLLFVDGWRRFALRLEAESLSGIAPPLAWWVRPLYSVSQAETGFEAVYQGSAVAAIWPAADAEAGCRLALTLTASDTPDASTYKFFR